MRSELQLEVNEDHANGTPRLQGPGGGVIMITPPIGEDYWLFRVWVSKKQAVIGFHKFNTIGIGFAREKKDWNTNLPFTGDAERIYEHIQDNKGKKPTREDCVAAIRMIQEAAEQLMPEHAARVREYNSRERGAT